MGLKRCCPARASSPPGKSPPNAYVLRLAGDRIDEWSEFSKLFQPDGFDPSQSCSKFFLNPSFCSVVRRIEASFSMEPSALYSFILSCAGPSLNSTEGFSFSPVSNTLSFAC